MTNDPKDTSVWLDSVPPRPAFPALEGEARADAIVIGGGIVGVLAAWRLAKAGKTVILLERGRVGAGDTAYTTAMLTRIPDTPLAVLRDRCGADGLKRLFAATAAAQEELFALIRSEGIDCDFAPCDTYVGSWRANDARLTNDWNALKAADGRVEWLENGKASAAPFAQAIRVRGEARFHVRKFLHGLLGRPLAKERIRVFEETEAETVDFGGIVRVRAARGAAEGEKLIVATGLPHRAFADLHPLFTARLSFVIGAEYAGAAPIGDHAYWDTEDPYRYFRRFGDRTLILGGADRDADAPAKGDPHAELLAWAASTFREAPRLTHRWSGTMFFTSDGLPYADAHPARGGQAYFVCGLGGNGMVMGALAAWIAADLACGKTPADAPLFSLARNGSDRKLKEAKPASAPPARPHPLLRVLLPLAWLAAVIAPVWIFFSLRGGLSSFAGANSKALRLMLFPLLGLVAFTLIWAQVMIGSNMARLERVFPRLFVFHRAQGVFALTLAILHPVFLATGIGFGAFLELGFVDPRLKWAVFLGDLQLVLLLTTVATALLMRRTWLKKRWRKIHLLNYAVFGLVWTHSWFLGTDVRATPLKWLWIFFALTVGASIAAKLAARLRSRAAAGVSADGWTAVGDAAALVEGHPLCANVGGREIAVFRLGARLHAVDNRCSHAGGPLCRGAVRDGAIECPWHRSRFDLATGAVKAGPAARPQTRYEVRERGGKIEVKA